MIDLEGKDKGNISLPTRLQPPTIKEDDFLFSEERKVMIMNMQKAFYEVKNAEIENKIKRLKDRNEYILDECTTVDLVIKLKDTETANNIAEIKHELLSKSAKIEKDNEEIEKIQQQRLVNKEEHEKKIKSIQGKYKNTRLILVSKMKILNAKINTLEDFKLMKKSLVEKLKKSNDFIMENEEKINCSLEQIDRKFKITREKLKNDLYQRLLNLTSNFQIDSEDGLSLLVERLTRENIIIKNELIQTFNDNVSKQQNTNEIKNTTKKYYKQIEENRKQIFRQISTYKIQANLLYNLKMSHSKLKNRLIDSNLFSHYSRKDKRELLEDLKMEEEKIDLQRRQLEVMLHRAQVKVNFASNKKDQTTYILKTLRQILYDVKFATCTALKTFRTESKIEQMTWNQLLLYLMNKMIKTGTEVWLKPINSIETIFPIDMAYRIGDLGFDTTDDIESTTLYFSKNSKTSSQHSGLEFLKAYTTKNALILPKIKKASLLDAMNCIVAKSSSTTTTRSNQENEEIETADERRNETYSLDEIKFVGGKKEDDQEF